MTDEARLLREALTSEDEIAHGEAFEPSRGGLGVCAYCDGDWPCRTQRGIDRLLARLSPDPIPAPEVEASAVIEYWRRQLADRDVDPAEPWPDADVLVVIGNLIAAHDAIRTAAPSVDVELHEAVDDFMAAWGGFRDEAKAKHVWSEPDELMWSSPKAGRVRAALEGASHDR